MLATLLFILWAYGMYALISTLAGRKGSNFRGRHSRRRYGWLALVAGAGVGLGLAIALTNSFDQDNHNLKLSGFLGTVWAEGWPDKVDQRVEYPPLKNNSAGDKPVYALLHPGTCPAEQPQEMSAPKPRPVPKPRKLHKTSAPQAKAAKPAVQTAKKEKGVTKNKSKAVKKKPAAPAAANKSAAG